VEIRAINWQDALPLRQEVLWPDKPISFCQVDGDEDAQHYGVYKAGSLVCVASVYKNKDVARLRKFATLDAFQRLGIGSRLIKHIMRELQHEGIRLFWCDARITAAGFYEKLGMEKQGEEFNKSGVLYFKMQIHLNSQVP